MYDSEGRIVRIQPGTLIVVEMLACVTWGLIAPGGGTKFGNAASPSRGRTIVSLFIAYPYARCIHVSFMRGVLPFSDLPSSSATAGGARNSLNSSYDWGR